MTLSLIAADHGHVKYPEHDYLIKVNCILLKCVGFNVNALSSCNTVYLMPIVLTV